MSEEIRVETAKVESLIPYEFNNKTHGDEEVDRLANSIGEFGYTYPILIDEKNIILAGHKRLLASKKLGLSEVPIIRKTGLTEAQKKAYRIIDNKSSQESPWDLENLELDLQSLEEMGFDIEKYIVNDFDFEEEEPEVVEDDHDGGPALNTKIRFGDTIELGDHRLICGDSTNDATVVCLMRGQQADLLVTDPPYNVAYEGKTKDALTIQNDSMSDESFLKFLTKVFCNAEDVLRGGGSVLYFPRGQREPQLSRGSSICWSRSKANSHLGKEHDGAW